MHVQAACARCMVSMSPLQSKCGVHTVTEKPSTALTSADVCHHLLQGAAPCRGPATAHTLHPPPQAQPDDPRTMSHRRLPRMPPVSPVDP